MERNHTSKATEAGPTVYGNRHTQLSDEDDSSSTSHPNTTVQLAEPTGPPPSYEEATGISPSTTTPSSSLSQRVSTSGSAVGVKPKLPARPTDGRRPQAQHAAPGSIPIGRQFPPTFNLYGSTLGYTYTLGEHQQAPLYAVVIRSSWNNPDPTVALHNGPNVQTAPLLAGVYFSNMSDNMSVTLPPPITYRGGSTAVQLDVVFGWSHTYRFSIEVGTDRSNVHQETFEWRHSSGSAIAALGASHEGWKLVRLNTPRPAPGQPQRQPALVTSDGYEVVALWADALMSLTKQLKFAFCAAGRTGQLGERWAVMAAISAIAIWEKELGNQARR